MRDGPTLALSVRPAVDTRCLIAMLSANAQPRRFKAAFPELTVGLCLASLCTWALSAIIVDANFMVLESLFSQRPDRTIHALVIGTLAIWALCDSCRPDSERAPPLLGAAGFFTLLAPFLRSSQFGSCAPFANAYQCDGSLILVGWQIAASFLPFAALIAAARKWASTRPHMTSAAAALAASASTAPTMNILMPAASPDEAVWWLTGTAMFVVAGLLAGPRFLRW